MDDPREPHPDPTSVDTPAEPPPPVLSPAAQKWLNENRDAIDAFNKWDEEHGSPLDEYRTF